MREAVWLLRRGASAEQASAERLANMVEVVTPPPQTDTEPHPITGAYEAAEWVRLRLCDVRAAELALISSAVAEASYYLSDTMDPEDRARILAGAESKLAHPAARDAATLLGRSRCREACDELARLLRGRHASAELRIALQALSGAEGDLAFQVQQKTNTSSQDFEADSLRGHRSDHAARDALA